VQQEAAAAAALRGWVAAGAGTAVVVDRGGGRARRRDWRRGGGAGLAETGRGARRSARADAIAMAAAGWWWGVLPGWEAVSSLGFRKHTPSDALRFLAGKAERNRRRKRYRAFSTKGGRGGAQLFIVTGLIWALSLQSGPSINYVMDDLT
jgi:hypothetical protein